MCQFIQQVDIDLWHEFHEQLSSIMINYSVHIMLYVQGVLVAGGAAWWATPARPGPPQARIMLTAFWVNNKKVVQTISASVYSLIKFVLVCTGIKDALYQEGGEYRCVGARAPDLMRLKELKRVTLKVTGKL